MASAAILIGNAHYARQEDLECCLEDVAAVRALIDAAGRHSVVKAIPDADADAMRDGLREALAPDEPYDEVFFYFSGHGAQIGSEFFYCGTNFDSDRPNETGLSHTELHELIRSVEPSVFVKVIDACASGTLLVKAPREPLPLRKEGFRSVVQLASCLDDQSSFAGEPLSAFTLAFCEACIRKTEGPIYYTDIINTLRDDFLENDDQTPHFVSQGTGRELLVDDARKLAPFREAFRERWSDEDDEDGDGDGDDGGEGAQGRDIVAAEPPTAKELIVAADAQMAKREDADALISAIFDGVLERFQAGDFAEFFDVVTVEHRDFSEPTARDFIIRVLAKESRPDNFVKAEIKRVKKRNAWSAMQSSLMMLNPEWTEEYDLELNCPLDRAQLKVEFNPKFLSLQQLILVLTCAPSLENCYLFEIVTQHPRTDWNSFDYEGREIIRRWYKLEWRQSVEYIVNKICIALEEAVQAHISNTTDRLSGD